MKIFSVLERVLHPLTVNNGKISLYPAIYSCGFGGQPWRASLEFRRELNASLARMGDSHAFCYRCLSFRADGPSHDEGDPLVNHWLDPCVWVCSLSWGREYRDQREGVFFLAS